MKTPRHIPILVLLSSVFLLPSVAQSSKKTVPVFENGEAQIVPAFENPNATSITLPVVGGEASLNNAIPE